MNARPATSASRLEFSRVDESADPQSFVDYLDGVTQATQAYKRLAFGLLEITEGDVLLDLGCGAGDDARAVARLVGPSGRVVGIDNSQAMIAEARR
jgi:ubiquinone/menaquinone biosynthesis C-methylase UbiE